MNLIKHLSYVWNYIYNRSGYLNLVKSGEEEVLNLTVPFVIGLSQYIIREEVDVLATLEITMTTDEEVCFCIA
jgi:hypothetical protein